MNIIVTDLIKMDKLLNKGLLFVFEGIDGTGKSTQAKLLHKNLDETGYDVVCFREPSDSHWGQKIRGKAAFPDSLTPEEEFELFVKDRKENVSRNLIPALEANKIVILDRYYFSTIAYQGAKGINPDRIRRENESFAPFPDLIFVFDLEPIEGLRRTEGRGRRDELFEREDYLDEVRIIFKKFQGDRFIHIDASESIEEIRAKIQRIVLQYIEPFLQ